MGNAGAWCHNLKSVGDPIGEPPWILGAGPRHRLSLLGAESGFAQGEPRQQTGPRGKSRRVTRPPKEPPVVIEEVLLLTREQAAEMCQVGLNKLDAWTREPGFPVIREGSHFVRIPARELKEWLARRAEEEDLPPPPPPPTSGRRRRRA
jgi:hypothetical protein